MLLLKVQIAQRINRRLSDVSLKILKTQKNAKYYLYLLTNQIKNCIIEKTYTQMISETFPIANNDNYERSDKCEQTCSTASGGDNMHCYEADI